MNIHEYQGKALLKSFGAPVAEVLVFATGLMSLGGLVGAVGQNWWRRRRGEPVAEPGPRAPRTVAAPDDGDEPTVEVLR